MTKTQSLANFYGAYQKTILEAKCRSFPQGSTKGFLLKHLARTNWGKLGEIGLTRYHAEVSDDQSHKTFREAHGDERVGASGELSSPKASSLQHAAALMLRNSRGLRLAPPKWRQVERRSAA